MFPELYDSLVFDFLLVPSEGEQNYNFYWKCDCMTEQTPIIVSHRHDKGCVQENRLYSTLSRDNSKVKKDVNYLLLTVRIHNTFTESLICREEITTMNWIDMELNINTILLT